MKSEAKKYENIVYSFMEFLRLNLSASIKRFYNPQSIPKPTDVDKWIIFEDGHSYLKLFTDYIPKIHCVARKDKYGTNMIGLITDVTNMFENDDGTKKYIPFYDKDTSTESSKVVIGDIWIDSLSVGPRMPYDTGIVSKMIEIHSTVKTGRRTI